MRVVTDLTAVRPARDGRGRDDRRVRRRAPRSPEGAAARARARGRARPRGRAASPSTGTRPRSCGPSRRRSCSRRSSRSSSSSTRTGYLDIDVRPHLRRGAQQGAGRGLRRRGARRPARCPPRDRRRRLPLRVPPRRHRPPPRADGRRARASRCSGSGWSRSRATPAACRTRRPGSASSSARASGARPPGCTPARPGPTRCGGRWWSATGGAGSSASRPRTSRCPPGSASPRTASTPGRSWAPTASSGRRAISLGRRPTFYEDAEASLLEAHLLDFDGDLYGQAGQGPLRRAPPGRDPLRERRRPDRADGPRRRGRPGGSSALSRSAGRRRGTVLRRIGGPDGRSSLPSPP